MHDETARSPSWQLPLGGWVTSLRVACLRSTVMAWVRASSAAATSRFSSSWTALSRSCTSCTLLQAHPLLGAEIGHLVRNEGAGCLLDQVCVDLGMIGLLAAKGRAEHPGDTSLCSVGAEVLRRLAHLLAAEVACKASETSSTTCA